MWAQRPIMIPGGLHPRRRGAYGRGPDAYVLLLFVQLIQQIRNLENKPPVTLALMTANAAMFFRDFLPEPLQMLVPSLGRACLQPMAILQGGQWSRLFWSAWVHADEYHLYYNLSSLLWKGARLERRMGPAKFAALTAELLLLSHGLVVAGAWAIAQGVPEYRGMYMSTCSVGFSAVLFAYKVVLNHDDPTYSSVLGFSLPTKYMAWAELLLASVFNPRASFFGHLCGIAAGLIHVRAAAALARRGGGGGGVGSDIERALRRAAAAVFGGGGGARPRFTGGGASGSAGGGASGSAARRQPRQAPAAAAPPPQPQPQQQRPSPPAPPAGGPAREAAAAGARPDGRVTGGAAAVSAEELRQRRLARFQQGS